MIDGMKYIANFLNEEEEKELLWQIETEKWQNDLKRQVQHFGYKYDYSKKLVDKSMKIENIPAWSLSIIEKMRQDGVCNVDFDQLIINKYLPGEGISKHIDCVHCFEDTIISISLGSNCIMSFENSNTCEKVNKYLERRSLLLLTGDARYIWTHSIPARKKDLYNGNLINRDTRISLTFRKVILN
jgi:alkylated DNA repair dioxygenase AlkB